MNAASCIEQVLEATPYKTAAVRPPTIPNIYNSSVPIQDVAWMTSRERWTIETGGERVSRRFILAARHDDDDNNDDFSH